LHFLMAVDIECFFKYLLVICFSSSGECSLRSCVYFYIALLSYYKLFESFIYDGY
jgi:hypothetical protein